MGLHTPMSERFTMVFSTDRLCRIMDRSNQVFHVLTNNNVQSTIKTHKVWKPCLTGLSNLTQQTYRAVETWRYNTEGRDLRQNARRQKLCFKDSMTNFSAGIILFGLEWLQSTPGWAILEGIILCSHRTCVDLEAPAALFWDLCFLGCLPQQSVGVGTGRDCQEATLQPISSTG